MSLAILFPGQGSQRPGMLGALPDSPAARSVLAESRSRLRQLGLPAAVDDAVALHDTTNVQLALLIAGVACARALIDDCGLPPTFVAGHSVGAFAAAAAVGVLTLAEAMEAVRLRGQLMKNACSQGDWGMAAVIGLSIRTVEKLVGDLHSDAEPLWVANVNSATQSVLSGSAVALQHAAEAAEAAGATDYDLLDVAVASHCPLQATTAETMRGHLAALPRRHPTASYLTNVRGRSVNTADAVLDDLAQAVAHPVQWYDAARLLPELGVTVAVEANPGHVLTRLEAANAPTLRALALQDEGLSAVAVRARRFLRP